MCTVKTIELNTWQVKVTLLKGKPGTITIRDCIENWYRNFVCCGLTRLEQDIKYDKVFKLDDGRRVPVTGIAYFSTTTLVETTYKKVLVKPKTFWSEERWTIIDEQ